MCPIGQDKRLEEARDVFMRIFGKHCEILHLASPL